MLLANLAVAALLVAITCMIHLAGLVGIMALVRERGRSYRRARSPAKEGAAILFIVFALFALHSIQIWVYAIAYLLLGEFGDLYTAVYFSTSSFTTVGFGDVTITDEWRMLGAAEGANGFLLIGWSTAFLVSLTGRVRAFEAEIEKMDDD